MAATKQKQMDSACEKQARILILDEMYFLDDIGRMLFNNDGYILRNANITPQAHEALRKFASEFLPSVADPAIYEANVSTRTLYNMLRAKREAIAAYQYHLFEVTQHRISRQYKSSYN